MHRNNSCKGLLSAYLFNSVTATNQLISSALQLIVSWRMRPIRRPRPPVRTWRQIWTTARETPAATCRLTALTTAQRTRTLPLSLNTLYQLRWQLHEDNPFFIRPVLFLMWLLRGLVNQKLFVFGFFYFSQQVLFLLCIIKYPRWAAATANPQLLRWTRVNKLWECSFVSWNKRFYESVFFLAQLCFTVAGNRHQRDSPWNALYLFTSQLIQLIPQTVLMPLMRRLF